MMDSKERCELGNFNWNLKLRNYLTMYKIQSTLTFYFKKVFSIQQRAEKIIFVYQQEVKQMKRSSVVFSDAPPKRLRICFDSVRKFQLSQLNRLTVPLWGVTRHIYRKHRILFRFPKFNHKSLKMEGKISLHKKVKFFRAEILVSKDFSFIYPFPLFL